MASKGRYCFDIDLDTESIKMTDDGRYAVTSDGDVISKARIKSGHNAHGPFSYISKEKKLATNLNKSGYATVSLSHVGSNKTKSCLVHRLVALAFVPNPENRPQVNHKDGNKTNNKPENLEWVTSQENVIHSYTTGLACNAEEQHPRSVLTVEDVIEIAKLYAIGVTCTSVVRIIGKKYQTIYKVLERKNWKTTFENALREIGTQMDSGGNSEK